MLPILQIGPLALPTPALLLLAGFWLGLELTEKQAHRFGASASQIYNMALVAVVAGIVGARLVYAARAPGAFLQSPLSLLAPTPQMLDNTGGLLIALLAALIYLRARRMALWPTLDASVTLFSVLAIAVGLANFASGDGFGAPAHLPWSIELWGEQRHPSQVYETLAALLVAAAVWPGSRVARHSLEQPGFRLWVFLALSAGARLILETYRGDSLLWMNNFRAAQVIAWLVLAVSLWQIGRRVAPASPVPEQQAG
jgi:phosphatidylglycerol---prolipoprotein diacylglyceryl transferase